MLTAYYALAGRVTRTQTARRFWVPIPRFLEGGVLDFSSKILRRFRSIFPTRCLLPPPQPLVLPPQPSEHGCSRPLRTSHHRSFQSIHLHELGLGRAGRLHSPRGLWVVRSCAACVAFFSVPSPSAPPIAEPANFKSTST